MALAHILLSPRSKGSNTPLKLYTYMASGKPILATEIEAHTQILDSSTSLLVPPTPQGLAAGALELLQNPELAQELANNAKKVKEELYSWKAFMQKNRRAYDAFMGKESGQGPVLMDTGDRKGHEGASPSSTQRCGDVSRVGAIV